MEDSFSDGRDGHSRRGLSSQITVDIPAEFRNRNCFVEVEYEGAMKRQRLFSHSLEIRVFEQTGQVRVMEASTKRPLRRVYVKVYGEYKERGRESVFVKDGFTDVCGSFDYASVSEDTNVSEKLVSYSVFICSNVYGSTIETVNAPSNS